MCIDKKNAHSNEWANYNMKQWGRTIKSKNNDIKGAT